MTQQELKIIVDIMSYADGGCPNCVHSLWWQLAERWPEAGPIITAHADFDRAYWE